MDRIILSKSAKRGLLRYGKIPFILKDVFPDQKTRRALGNDEIYEAFKTAFHDYAFRDDRYSVHYKQLSSINFEKPISKKVRRAENNVEKLFERLTP